jgi:hypothetical protein
MIFQANISVLLSKNLHLIFFDLPDSRDTVVNQQVYERSAIYRMIATPGRMRARRYVVHPLTCVSIPRTQAWSFVCLVNSSLLEIIHCEQQSLGLALENEEPINNHDHCLHEQTMQDCGNL